MLAFPEETAFATKEAIVLWMNAIVPALFPFFIISGIIRRTDLLNVISCKFLPAIMGFFSGYPVAAQIALEYYKSAIV